MASLAGTSTGANQPRRGVGHRAVSLPAGPAARKTAGPRITAFAEPNADGSCPDTHPVKAKLSSGIYHVPGSGNYERTNADRCYANAEAAEADGLRPAKR